MKAAVPKPLAVSDRSPQARYRRLLPSGDHVTRNGNQQRVIEALSLFHSLEHPPGLVRALGLASIMLLSGGPSELGARVAGATYRLVREKGLMLGPVHVLHLPEPSMLAEARFGPERAADLMAEGETMTTDDLVAALAASPPPGAPPADAARTARG